MIKEPLRTAIVNYWKTAYFTNKVFYEPNARVISGDIRYDSWLYILEQTSGIEVETNRKNMVTGCRVVDEQKFAWFLLQWS